MSQNKKISTAFKVWLIIFISFALLFPTVKLIVSKFNVVEVTSIEQIDDYYSALALLNFKSYKLEPTTYDYVGQFIYSQKESQGTKKHKTTKSVARTKKMYSFTLGEDYIYTLTTDELV